MKHTIAIIITSLLSITSNAQIILSGYKCLFYDGQTPYTMAEMYCKNDTFRFTLLSRDIWGEMGEENDRRKELKIGLHLCFDTMHYFKTRDSLYISTGRFASGTFYYKVYVPDKTVSLSIRSNRNDSAFADKSKWLLSQIRLNRKKDVYFVNEKNQDCQIPPEFKN